MKKRFLSILMALCLTLTLLPTAALAAEGDETQVAQIGDKTYASLSSAMFEFGANDTLVLLADCETSYLQLPNNSVIDLNGHDLTYTGNITIIFSGIGRETTITDSTASGQGTGGTLKITGQRDGSQSVFEIGNATLNVNNINIESTGCVFYPRGNSAELNITNCNIKTSGVYCVSTNAGDSAYYGVTINIIGSSLTADAENKDDCAVMMNVSGSLNIEDSIITGNRQGVFARAGDVTIVDSEIVVTGAWADTDAGKSYDGKWKSGNEVPTSALIVGNSSDNAGSYKADATATISNTEITAPRDSSVPAIYVDANVNYAASVSVSGSETVVTGDITNPETSQNTSIVVTGGQFLDGNGAANEDVQTYFPDDTSLTVDENGKVVTDTKTAVAEVNGVPYKSLEAAIEAAPAGATVTLVADAVLDANGITGGNGAQVLTIDKDLTIDGQGQYTIKGENFAENVRLITVTNGADVTFANVILDGNNTEGTPGTQGARHGLNLWNAGTVTLNNVTINNCDWYAVANNGSNLIVNGLTTNGNAWGINLDNNATATINNANISETSSIVYENGEGGGSLTVNGGTFQNVVVQAEEEGDACGGRIDLKGGSFIDITTSGQGTYNDTGIVTVSGGTYQKNVSKYLADGLAWNSSTGAVYDPSQNRPSSGSSSSEPSYSPKLDVSDGGSIKVNPRTPEEDDEVTITVDPDSGYEVDEVTVTDRNGREVKVTAERDGTYTFTQPRGRVTISVTFVREGGSTFFSDVPESFWAYDEIAWAYDNGYVNGTSASSFSPNASISRQQVWMILARLSGADPANMSAAREWAVTNGVSDGTTPGGAVTRQQLVALLYRYATLMGYANDQRADLSAYPDAGTVAGYAVEPMQWSVANSIVGGTSNGTLDPTGTATRAQFAVILYRFWDQVG